MTISGYLLKLTELREKLEKYVRASGIDCEEGERLDSLVPKVCEIKSDSKITDDIVIHSKCYVNKYVVGEAVTL
jgi:hypothetical protein